MLVGLAEQFGLACAPTYGIVFTFVIMALVLAAPAAGHPGEARMSAAHWRKAMNFSAPAAAGRAGGRRPLPADTTTAAAAPIAKAFSRLAPRRLASRRRAAGRAGLSLDRAALLHLSDRRPGAGRWDLIALSLTFLAGYGGVLSLAQMTVAGIAGYIVAILGVSGTPEISLGWPWWLVVAAGDRRRHARRHLDRLAVGAHEGIYTIMITLAIGMAFFYLAQQNYAIFNGWGFQKVVPPVVLDIDWRSARTGAAAG